MIAFVLHANACNCVLHLFFWNIPYFTVYRVCPHDGRVFDLVVEVIILNWHNHSYYFLTYLYHSC